MLNQISQRIVESNQAVDRVGTFSVMVVRGSADVRNALNELRDVVRPLTAFQTITWLEKAYAHLAPANASVPHLVVVRWAQDGEVILVLPLAVVHERGHCAAGFPDFGLSDYGAPLVARHGPVKLTADDVKELWKSLARALTGIDRLSLTNMPMSMSSTLNPLAMMNSATPASHARHVVELESTVEAFLASRGKKYRKEVERCFRLLAEKGAWRFECAKTPDEIASAFSDLERLQSSRWQGRDGDYNLHNQAVSRFYSDVLLADNEAEAAQIFTLKCSGKTIAVLYGVVFENTFTLLRIASADGIWRRMSPGRLIVIEAMRHFVSRQIKCFDLGIGDYAFKRGLGAKSFPLVDIEQAIGWKAMPFVMLMQAKGWLRQHPQLLQAAKAARQKMSR